MKINEKVRYVKRQGQTRRHECHWPGCSKQVPPAMWGCSDHWYRLPEWLRRQIWKTYRPGQERTMTPSRAYLDVADKVQRWIRNHLAGNENHARRPSRAALTKRRVHT